MPYKANEGRRHKIPRGALQGRQLAGIRQGVGGARQFDGLGDARSARGLAGVG